MTNEYLNLLESGQSANTQAGGNPYLQVLQGEHANAEARFRASTAIAVDSDPDAVAQAKRVAAYLGTTPPAVEALPGEAQRAARIRQIDEATTQAPATRRAYTDADFARIAHDDAGALATVERWLRNVPAAAVSGLQRTSAGVVGLVQAPLELAAPALDPLAGTVLPENPLRRVAGGLSAYRQWIEAQSAANRPQAQSNVEAGFYSGVGSLASNLTALPLLFAPGGQGAALAAMAAPVGGQAYGEARDKGVAPVPAAVFGLSQAAIEYATEKIPVSRLLGDLKAGSSFGKMLARQVAAEIPGEQVATILQDLNEWAVLNPGKPFAEYLRERPDAAVQTLVATIVGSGGQVSVVKGIDLALRRFGSDEQRAQAAQDCAQRVQAVVDAAAASKLRARDPQSFEQFVQQAAEAGPVHEVFIPAETFAQELGRRLDEIARAVPAVREQLDEALVTGGTLAIPIEQFAAYVPQDVAQSLVPHLRTAPEAMSLREAETFAQEGHDQLRAEVDSLTGASEQGGAQDAVEQVRAAIVQQLQATGRFTADVNGAYAELLTRFFEATAERSGTDAHALFAELGPRIVSQLGESAGQLDQPAGEQAAGGIDTAGANDATGAPLEQARRGAYDPSSRTIALLAHADLSTFIHEAAHHFLEVQVELAGRPGATPQMAADMQSLMNWFGVADLSTWRGMTLEEKRPHHEQFARGFEAYAFEGAAPSQELQGVFNRFRAWLLRVYRSLAALRVELSPEVRAVFGRMIATDAQIQQAETMRSYRPLFESAEAAGMTAEEWADYQASGAQATGEAVENLQRRSLRDMQWLANARGRALRKLQRDAKEKRAAIEAEVRAEVDATPIYQAWRDLARGKSPDGHPVRLSLPELKDSYPALLERIPRHMATNEGMPADMVAEAYGLESGDQLLKLLATLDPPDVVIEAQTDVRMLERYGDLSDGPTIERAADELIHNQARARFLEREVNALGKAVGSQPVVARAARQYAEEAVARRKVRQIRPAQFSAAEARAAKAAEQAFKKGETAAAAVRKREQLLQHELARVAHRVAGEIDRALDYLRQFDTAATRQAVGADYADQIEALLERFDLRAGTTDKEISRRKSLAEWVESQREQGFEPQIDERLLADSRLTHYRDLTVEELRGLVDTVKNIEHLGRLKQRLLTVQDQRQFGQIVSEVALSIETHGGKVKPVEIEGRKGVIPWLQGVWASHRKIASLVRQMDGGKDAGPLWRVLVRGMNDAGTREQVMVEQATLKLAELYAPLLKLKGGIDGAKVFIPEIRHSLSRGGRIAVALNWGNEGNRQRLLDGELWTGEQVAAIMGTLSPVELQFVNKVWEFIDSYWPAIEAKQLRVSGLAEEKVQADPFTVTASDGTQVQMRGGYYPIKYDADRSSRAESLDAAEVAKDMMRGAFTRATTRRGHTKARAEAVKRPLLKNLDVITRHVTQVTHDLAWHEWLIDANRLLAAKPIDDAIRTYYGPDVVKTLKDSLSGIAAGDVVAQSRIDEALRALRANVTRSVMGLSFTTAMLQPFGLTQSMARIGVKPVLRGVARWAGDAVRLENSLEWIQGKSDFMRLRAKTFNRELSEINARVSGRGGQLAQVRDAALFFLTQKMQMVADVPTWIGAYEKALGEGRDDAAAVALADQAVLDSQGGGQIKDLAEVQRKHPFLTQFYSYFSTTLNLVAESTAATNFRSPRAVGGWLGDMALLVVIPAIAPMLVLSMLRGDDDDMAKEIAKAQAGYLLGMLVLARELSGIVSGFAYSGPPVSRIATDVSKAAGQVQQGEVDEPAVLAVVRLLGTAFGIPTVQAVRSYKGWKAWDEGDAPASAVLFGPPQKHN